MDSSDCGSTDDSTVPSEQFRMMDESLSAADTQFWWINGGKDNMEHIGSPIDELAPVIIIVLIIVIVAIILMIK